MKHTGKDTRKYTCKANKQTDRENTQTTLVSCEEVGPGPMAEVGGGLSEAGILSHAHASTKDPCPKTIHFELF